MSPLKYFAPIVGVLTFERTTTNGGCRLPFGGGTLMLFLLNECKISMTELSDSQLERYSRHILLNQVDVSGQTRLLQSRVLVIGCGGLGSACVPFLASSGVGHLILVDDDLVELSNLQRQTAYRTQDIGNAKVVAMAQTIGSLNPDVQVLTLQERVDEKSLMLLMQSVDVVVDCTDNFETRHFINRICVLTKTPLVSGSAVRFEGQLAVYDARDITSPCYACAFENSVANTNDGACATLGIFAPVVGVIGVMQANLALQVLLQLPLPMGQLQTYNALTHEWLTFKLMRYVHCSVCGSASSII